MNTLKKLFNKGLVKEGDIVTWNNKKYFVKNGGCRSSNLYGEGVDPDTTWISSQAVVKPYTELNPFLIEETTYKLDRRTKILELDSGNTITLGGGTGTFQFGKAEYSTKDIPSLIECLQNFYDAVKKDQTQ